MMVVFQDVLALVWIEMFKDNIKLSLNKNRMQKIVTWKKNNHLQILFQMKCRQVLPFTNDWRKKKELSGTKKPKN